MAICLDRNSLEYRTLYKIAKGSGISGFLFDSISSHFVEKYGRFPKLEELPTDSSKYLLDQLKVTTDNNNVKVSKKALLKYLKLDEEATDEMILDSLKKAHTDLVIEGFTNFDGGYSFTFYKYPTRWTRVEEYPNNNITDFFNTDVLNSLIDKILATSDKKIIKVTDAELSKPFWRNKIDSSRKITKAFVYNGNIYINMDHASIEDPVHELLHLVLGYMARSNYKVYSNTLQKLKESGAVDSYLKSLKGLKKSEALSEMDALEEVFVRELSKHLTGQKSILTTLSEIDKQELSNMVISSFDKILNAQSSLSIIPNIFRDNYSLKETCEYINSLYSESNKKFIKDYLEQSAEYRIDSNILNSMIRTGDIIENCD